MPIKKRLVIIAAVVTSFAQAASLNSLLQQADTIVIGTETSPIKAGTIVSFTINVEQVFTGSVAPGQKITVDWDTKMSGQTWNGAPSYRGLWFLKGTTGVLQCIPAGRRGNVTFFQDLSFPVGAGPMPPQLVYSSRTTPLADRLALEIAAGQFRNPSLLLDAISGMSSTGSLQALHYLASQSGETMLVGIAGLIQRGDVPALLQAESVAGNLTSIDGGSGQVISAISSFYRNTDPLGIASLGRMAVSDVRSSQLRSGAAAALAAIHTPAAVPWLGQLLSDPSAQMQVYGAQGLSFFANGVGIPNASTAPTLQHLNQRQPSSYENPTTEQHIGYIAGQSQPFVAFWLAWWRQHPELHGSN